MVSPAAVCEMESNEQVRVPLGSMNVGKERLRNGEEEVKYEALNFS
jgi:hypothetical protein